MNSAEESLTARVNRLHEHGVVDMHFDLLMDLYEKRRRSNVFNTDYLPQFEAGGVGVVAAAIYLLDEYLPELGLRVALDQVARLYIEQEVSGRFSVCRSHAEILRARRAGRIAVLITMEGVEPLGEDINLLRIFYELGLRSLGLTHARRNAAGYGGIFAPSGSSPVGLTSFGREIVRQCEALGILLDLAHLNPAGFEEVMAMTTRPLIVSHSNARRYYDIERNISDEQIRMVGERGGVIGVNALLVTPRPEEMHLDRYVDHIDHIVDLIGIEGVGIGFDFFEQVFQSMPAAVKEEFWERFPEIAYIPDLKDHSHTGNLTHKLIERGYKDQEIEKILHGNFTRVFQEVLTG
jgi:membrane dipeptidase